MLVKNKKELFDNLLKLVGIISIYLALTLIIFYPDSYNVDWGAYKELYNDADTILPYAKSNYFFISLFSFLNDYLSYKYFRFFLTIINLFILYFIFKKSNYKISNLNIFICLPIIAFLILKIHVQIREGTALSIYFLTLLSLKDKKIFSIKNILLSLTGILIHPGLILIWIPSIIFIIKKNVLIYKRPLIYTFFFLIALITVNSQFRFYINGNINILQSHGINIEEYLDSHFIEINLYKIFYWFSYLILFFAIYIEELRMNSVSLKKTIFNEVSLLFGALSLNGLLVFLPTVFISSIFLNVNSLDYNLIYRVIQLLFSPSDQHGL